MRESPFSDSCPEAHGRDEDQGRCTGTSQESLERFLLEPEARSCPPERWEQLRDLAVGGMQRPDLPAEVRLRWGRLSLSAISGKYRTGLSQQMTAESARARAYMIKEFGASETDPARNLPVLCSDVLRDVGMPWEEAARLGAGWRTAPREQMLQLRRIKNMLTPLLLLQDLLEDGKPEGDGPASRQVRAWLELVPKLP
ncbi:hypothetical protein [Streptomyces sp. NBC_00572]|uniref:hypothetical protein n=1 Tax=Streptomyces sp. NBC_00572 TaxID=2903664 RepID=UPI00224FE510|nr:hypothetical protein [Streptomyces sp. NBC_00572]MCX4981975.1 hypothetical protein [Streptomyces sp. NBC_00572]